MKLVRTFVSAIACGSLFVASSAQAQLFGGGKPDIPDHRMLDVYDQTVLDEELEVGSVSAGLLGNAALDAEGMREAGLDPEQYTGTLSLLQQFVNAIAAVGPRPDVVPRVNLKLHSRPDAWAEDQQNVVLTTAMLDALVEKGSSEDEMLSSLGFILAHEYAHILYNHPTLYAKKEDDFKVAGSLAKALVFASQMQGLANQVSPQLAQANAKATQTLATATALSPVIETELYRVGVAPYKRDEEARADYLAIDLMRSFSRENDAYTAVMNPQVGIQAIEVFRVYDNSVFGQLKTAADRLDDNMKVAGKEIEGHADQFLAAGNVNAFLSQSMGSLAKSAFSWAIDIFARRYNKDDIHIHYSSEKRRAASDQYLDLHYTPVAEFVDEDVFAQFGLDTDIPSADAITETFKREYAFDRAAQNARKALMTGDVAGARAALDTVDAGTARSAYFHQIDGNVATAESDFARAEQAYSRAIAFPEATLHLHRQLIMTQVYQGKFDTAMASVDRAAAIFGEDAVITDRLQIMIAQEKIDEARTMAEVECEKLDDKKDVKNCLKTVPDPPKEKGGMLGVF